MEVNKMTGNNEFQSVDEALEMLGDILSGNNDFNTQTDELQKLTESLITNLPKVSQDVINEYQGYIDRLLSVREEYKDHYDELEQQTLKQTVRYEYTSGGESIHRGFYCPSPVLDKLVGGYNRGMKIQKPRANSGYYYKYYFDGNNRIIRSDCHTNERCYSIEFMIQEDNSIYGVTFNTADGSSGLISMECYSDSGTLDKYITVLPDLYSGRDNHNIYSSEKYEYDKNDVLRKVIYASGIPKLNLISEESYAVVYEGNDIKVRYTNDD